MAGEKSLYLVARGGYVDSSLAAEMWQCGIRLFCDVSTPDPTGTFPTTGTYVERDDSRIEDGFTIHSEWAWMNGTDSVIEPVDYLHDQAMPAWQTFMEAVAISSKVQLRSLRLYPMEAGGHAFESRVAVGTYDTPPVGGRSGDLMPPEVSIVVSLNTSRPGPKGRGRFFTPPTTTSGVSAQGQVLGTLQGDLADAAQALLEGLAFSDTTDIRPCVSGGTLVNYSIVNALSIGSVFDAQRRRRQSLVETRTFRAPTYP